ncbi:hypothetical protein I8U24_13030 [Thermoactinomyces sp. CICC 24226]|uniref:hypothetical protein n=1 Tax=Thermoactinomyces sp. CICC 24226 TaxID=2767431 RepID=UPI0018DBB9A8|nr:hypothetical protein [Thermoactinomyces sp. CICC 24226]MBI0393017.1 hypothetical protein [Thermoactinomyces sp. CICC 24226]
MNRFIETIKEKEHCIDNIFVLTDFIKCLNSFKDKEGYGEEGNLIHQLLKKGRRSETGLFGSPFDFDANAELHLS